MSETSSPAGRPPSSSTSSPTSPPQPGRRGSINPAHLALRDGLRQFIRRRVQPDHVDDLVQEVFLRMHEHSDDLRDEERVAGWAFRIARNVVVDHHRRARGAPSPDLPDDLAADDEPNEGTNVNEVVAGWLRPMIALLPTEYAEALECVELEGLTQQQYADRAGLSLSGAKSRVQRGRKLLESIVRVCCDIEQDARGNVIGYTRRADGADETCRPDSASMTCPGCSPRR